MKKFNFLSKLWSSVVGSQRNDVEFDHRLTVGSPSGLARLDSLSIVSRLSDLHTRVVRYVAIMCMSLTLCVRNMYGTDIAKWGKISISASTDYKASGGDKNNNGTAKFSSNKAMTSSGTGTSKCYYGSGAGGAVITFSNLNLSTYTSIQMTFYARASQSGNMTLAYSMDGASWVDINSASLSTTEGQKTITGIPYYATYLRLTHDKSTGSLYFGTVVISGTTATMRTVTWYINGETTTAGSPTTSVPNGATVGKLPTSPTSSDCGGSKVFVGWTASEIDGTSDTEPTDLFATYLDAPTVSAATDYYAVFATATPGDDTDREYSFLTSSATSTSTSAGWSITNAAASYADTYGATWQRNNLAALPIFTFTPNVRISKISIKVRQSNTTGSNTVACSAGGTMIDSYSMSGTTQYTMDFTPSFSSKGRIVITCTNTSASGTGKGSFYVASITLKEDATTYSSYVTTCESCDAPTALTKGSFNSSTHKQPINWTSDAGKVDICYSTSSTKPSSTPGSGYTVISGETGYTDKSNTYELNVSSFAPGDYYVWARSVCSESAKSDWVAMTSNYFTLTGYTLTLNKSGGGTSSTVTGDPTWTSVVPGNQVSVTASPASGYAFESWSVSGTSSTLSSTTTNPTTFTMGSANSTVTATFSEVKVSSLTLHALKKDNTDASIFDETGSDVALAMYPTEGKTASPADPLGHTAKIEFGAVLPSDALDNTYTWSATVNGVATAFSSNDLTTNSVIEFNKSSGKLVAKAAGTAEIIITANDGSGVSAKVTITVTNVALTSVSVDPSSMNVYVGQILPVAVAYNPANVTTKGYSYAGNTNVTILNKANDSFNVRGDVVTVATNNTVTITTTSDSRTADLSVTVKPLPTVHFVDIIHNETFSDVVATVDESDKTIVHFDKTVPTHADISPAPASGNDCEKEHLHLIGWIRSDYSKVSAYMEGTGDAPTNAEITGAGAGYYYAAGATITLTDALHGKTFYAVWAKTE